MTVIGGTDAWKNATGQLVSDGNFNLSTERGESQFRGEICVPTARQLTQALR
jgi:hypothetical protein